MFWTPPVRTSHTQPLPRGEDVAWHGRDRRLGFGHHVALCVDDLESQVGVRHPGRLVPHLCAHGHRRQVVVDLGREQLQTARHQVDPSALEQPDAAVEAAPRVPAAVVVGAGLDLDLIGLAGAQQVVDLHGEVRVAPRSVGDQGVVDPDPCVAVDALEFQDDGAPGLVGRQLERLLVLPVPAREVGRRRVPGRRAFGAEHGVVGQGHLCRRRARSGDQLGKGVRLGSDRPAVIEWGTTHGPASYATRDVIAIMRRPTWGAEPARAGRRSRGAVLP